MPSQSNPSINSTNGELIFINDTRIYSTITVLVSDTHIGSLCPRVCEGKLTEKHPINFRGCHVITDAADAALDRDRERLRHMIKTGTLPNGSHKCLLCSDEDCERPWIGMFWCEGDLAQRLGAKPGKARGILYLLCEECHELPNKESRIEQTLIARAGVQ